MKRSWLIGAALVFSLTAVGCNDDDDEGTTPARDGGTDSGVDGGLRDAGGLDSGLDAAIPGDAGRDAGDAG